MPHVTVKHFPRTLDERQRARLAARITEAVVEALDVDERVVSVSLQPVEPEAWDEQVYRPEVTAHPDRLIKAPRY